MASTNFFRIEAPYPALASTVLLAQPDVGNNEGLVASVVVIKMEDGSRRSFVKRGEGKKRYRWSWTMSHDKMEEFADFVNRYRGKTFRVTWRERIFIGKVNLNPVEFRGDGRAGGWPGNEAYNVTIEMVESE